MRDLKADLELCEKATPGPWRDFDDTFEPAVYTKEEDGCRGLCIARMFGLHSDVTRNNARCIAEAREGWPEAIQRALAAEERVRELEQERDALLRVVEEVWLQWGFELSSGRRDAGCVGVLKHAEDILRRYGRINELGRFAWEEAERDARTEAR